MANKDMKTATETEKDEWKTTCEADAKADFEAAGGDPMEWEAAKEEGARSKGADKMKSCIEGEATAAGKDIKTATEAEKDGWKTTCEADAKADFEAEKDGWKTTCEADAK